MTIPEPAPSESSYALFVEFYQSKRPGASLGDTSREMTLRGRIDRVIRAANIIFRRGFASEAGTGKSSGIASMSFAWKSTLTVGVLGAGTLGMYALEKRRRERRVSSGRSIGRPDLGGSFSLIDENGRLRRSSDFSGSYWILYFGFTHCPDLCPSELAKITQAMKILDSDKNLSSMPPVQAVFISVDPTRDTPAALMKYKNENDYHPRFSYLTGSVEAITKTAKKFRAYFSAPEGDANDYLVDHSLHAYLLDRQGVVLDIFGKHVPAHELAAKIRDHMMEAADRDLEDDQIQLQASLIKQQNRSAN